MLYQTATAFPSRHAPNSTAQKKPAYITCHGLSASGAKLQKTCAVLPKHEAYSHEASEAPSTGCPFLRSLQPLPSRSTPLWFQPLSSILDPLSWGAKVLQGDPVVKSKTVRGEVVAVGGISAIKQALSLEADGTGQLYVPPIVAKLFGSGSMYLKKGERHMTIRRLLLSVFATEEVMKFLPRLEQLASKYLQRMASSPGGTSDAAPLMKNFTFEVIATVVLGLQFEEQTLIAMSDAFETWAAGLADPIGIDLPFTPLGKALAARKVLIAAIKAQMALVAAAPQGGVTELGHTSDAAAAASNSILKKLMTSAYANGDRLSEDEIADSMLFILFAGHDTTGGALVSMLLALHENRDVTAGLVDEQRQVISRHGTAVSPAAMEDMTLLDAAIWEVLRVRPVAPAVFRRTTADVELEGHQVPAEEELTVLLGRATLADPRWANETGDLAPGVFNPDRFLGVTPRGKDGSQMTFGMGMRTCIGMSLALAEMRVMVSLLLRNYTFDVPQGIKFTNAPVLKADGPALVRLQSQRVASRQNVAQSVA